MKASRLLGVLAVLLLVGPVFGQRLPQTIDDGQRNAIEAFVRQIAGGSILTRIACPATNAWYVSSDIYGPIWFGADLLNANGEGAWRIVFENNARWNIVASEAVALEGGEQDPVALSQGYLDAAGVAYQIMYAAIDPWQISGGVVQSESDPVAMSQGFVSGAPWQSEGYLTSLSGHGTSELNNDSGFLEVSGDSFGLGSGFNIYGYAYGTEGRIPDYEQDRVAMSQGFLVSESDPVAMAAGFISGGDVPNYETDPVAMSQGFGPSLTQVIEWPGNVRIGPDTWFCAMDFGCAMDVNEKSIVLSVPGDGGINLHTSHGGDYTCELYIGSRNIGETAFFFNQAIYVGGTKVINKDGTFSEADPVAMSQGFITANFPGAQDGDLVVVAGNCSSLSSMEPTTWLASHENDPIAMSQGFLTSVPWDASVAYASEAGYAGSANTAYSADECSSWGGWTHVAIQGNGGQPTVGDMIFMSDAGLTMLSQYNISTPNPPVFLGSEWHDGVGNMPKWVLQSDMQAGYAAVSGSTSNVVSGIGQNFSLTNAFAGVTQVVVFADGVVTNRFKLP